MPRALHRDYWRSDKRSESEVQDRNEAQAPVEPQSSIESPSVTAQAQEDYPQSHPEPVSDSVTVTPSLSNFEFDDAAADDASIADQSSISGKTDGEGEDAGDADDTKKTADEKAETRSYAELEKDFLERALPLTLYKYHALPRGDDKFFRLFALEPGKDWEPIHGRLNEYHLNGSDRPEYTAISYYWGSEGRSAFVELRGDDGGYYVQVSANLKLALKHLRSPDKELFFWADAICIKQDANLKDAFDREEKRHQLSMMREIYERADKVAIFLGRLTKSTWEAFDVCMNIVRLEGDLRIGRHGEREIKGTQIYAAVMRQLYQSGQSSSPEDEKAEHQEVLRSGYGFSRRLRRLASYTKPSVNTSNIQHLLNLLKLPWFKRVWVLQEAAYGRRVTLHCGEDVIDWQTLAAGAMVIRRAAEDSGSARINASQELVDMVEFAKLRAQIQRTIDGDTTDKPGIIDLLNKYRRWDSVNTVDKIYALLNLINDTEKQALRENGFDVNFARSEEETFRKFAEAILKSTVSLDVLNSPKGNGRLSSRLPSWVPDWTDTGFQADMSLHSIRTMFHATQDSVLATPQFSESGKVMPVGSVIDHIAERGDYLVTLQERQQDLVKEFPLLDRCFARGQELEHFVHLLDFLVKTGDVLAKWSGMARVNDTATVYPTSQSQSHWDAFRRTLTLDMGKKGLPPKTISNHLVAFHKWQKETEGLREFLETARDKTIVDEIGDAISEPSTTLSSRARKLLHMRTAVYNLHRGLIKGGMNDWDYHMDADLPQAHHERFQGRRLARTASGLLGLVPAEAQEGDNIVLLQGGSVPYVLRPKDRKWELVGCAYVHGIMQGERWNERSCFRMELD